MLQPSILKRSCYLARYLLIRIQVFCYQWPDVYLQLLMEFLGSFVFRYQNRYHWSHYRTRVATRKYGKKLKFNVHSNTNIMKIIHDWLRRPRFEPMSQTPPLILLFRSRLIIFRPHRSNTVFAVSNQLEYYRRLY